MYEEARDSIRRFILFTLPLISLVLIWQAVCSLDLIKMLPSPLEVAKTLLRLSFQTQGGWPVLALHLSRSLLRVGAGFALAMVAGIGVGLLMGTNRYADFLLRPIFSVLLPVPTLAWVPILLIWTGTGDDTIIIAIFLGGFFSIAYNTATGVRSIDRDLILAAKTMGATRWTLFTRVLLPGSMVPVLAGLRLAVGYSWRALVGAEMLAAAGWGLGYLVFAARAFMAVNVMFAGLITIMATGYIMENLLVGSLEKRTVKKWGMIRI